MKRREFLKDSSVVAGAAVMPDLTFIYSKRGMNNPASDQLNLGLIGCRGRGFHVLEQHLNLENIQCSGICDVDENVIGERMKDLKEKYDIQPKIYADFRRLLEDKDIDAVIIGTPDHWHCLPTVYACQEGKDVYVEKPLANSIEECNLIVKAAQKYNRIVQVGQQQRSARLWNEVMDFVKSGKLGKIRKANIWGHFNYGAGPYKRPDGPAPDGVDYDLWLGPAPKRTFNPSRFHGTWRFFWDYGGGLMTDWGVHLIDMAFWAKDIVEPPRTVLAYGSDAKPEDRDRETFGSMSVVFPMNDYIIQWDQEAGVQVGPYDRLYGIAFIGDNGTVVADRSRWEVYPEWDDETKEYKFEKTEPVQGTPGHDLHIRDFVSCVKTRQQPACPAEVGRAVALSTHFANIAVRTGTFQLNWDEEKNRFTNSKIGNQLIEPVYRKPWKLPSL
jgi:predicted dehydrogenase